MSDNSNNSGSGCGSLSVPTVLGIVFVTLKLTHYIDWPWIWVLAPFWVGYVLVAIVFAVILGWAAILAAWANK